MEVSCQLQTPAILPLWKEASISTRQEAGWAPEPIWNEYGKICCPYLESGPGHPAHSLLLYWLEIIIPLNCNRTQGWRPCSVKKLLLRNPNRWKLDGIIQKNLAESSKVGYGWRRAVFPMMNMMMICSRLCGIYLLVFLNLFPHNFLLYSVWTATELDHVEIYSHAELIDLVLKYFFSPI
jgi:hypothetical protein